jgi:hypothetical protein
MKNDCSHLGNLLIQLSFNGGKVGAVGFSLPTISTGHCNENPIYVFPEKELRSHSPNFHNHASVSDLYIPRVFLSRIGRKGILRIFVSNFRYCVFAV